MANQAQKKRLQENKRQIEIHTIALLVVNLVYIVYRVVFHAQTFGGFQWFAFIVMSLGTIISWILIRSAASPTFSRDGELLDAGSDLSGKGLIEYAFDILYITWFAQTLGLFSDWGLLVYLLIPGFAGYKALTSFLLPWVFSSNSEDEMSLDPKALKKAQKQAKKEERGKIKWLRG
eukprot:TRINITY_DN16226_c0_g1::TRINITY_DN16226_c0_g1_i1::g.6460::m.6460 TRINITY_DN16226_c0_g1::TRINITY_DN16226_c0_g1_i1::g.6460  ORF type:complete len:176 (-),score=13.67,sp/Q54UB0/TM208_DICDI/36.31/7e-32,DUF788/PF05620.6/5.9e-42,2TM/PF13239.1/0.0014,2TM/PF13239.1/1.3e+03,2TM/PF13239.1/1.5e+04,Sugar_transport/PF06800.7/0.0034,Sugar_transport/PF06800.7/2.7e+03,DUF2919/PF11143.3/0.025,DUF2919/PF11143.3/3.5e+03,DUF3040/PF11239.3/0.16,RseC_MucC/PF04246.7/1.5,RseC_MucC/PF04246.7/3.1e+02 TRINITY_DN16226_c0_g1